VVVVVLVMRSRYIFVDTCCFGFVGESGRVAAKATQNMDLVEIMLQN
jgi:hypothetical protein